MLPANRLKSMNVAATRFRARQIVSEFERLIADATTQHDAGNLERAEAGYRAALAVVPGHALVLHNLGVVQAAQKKHQLAIDLFDQVIAAQPQYASAHYNRGVALQELGQTRDAISAFSRACAIEPAYYDAHRALGFMWLAERDRGRALDHFARTYELRRGEDRTSIAEKSLNYSNRSKLIHDSEQFAFLAERRRDGRSFEMLARTYAEVANGLSEEVTKLSDHQLDILGDDYNTAIHVRNAPDIAEGAVSERLNEKAINRGFKEHKMGAVVFDNFLTPTALSGLQRYLLESTIWHDYSHISGFVASYLEDGLACPLLLQIVDELRARLPEVLGPHSLTQAWAFKALQPRAAVDVHADSGAVSVNFWVTRNDANMNPQRGGLSIYQVPPPDSWEVRNYDRDKNLIVAFLGQHPAKTLIVPYRENRAVLFESGLFHSSDIPEFRNTYENHRINVTLLFGQH